MRLAPILIIINTIVYIFGSKHTKRGYQLGIVVPAVVYIIVMLILKNSIDISHNMLRAAVGVFTLLTIEVQNIVLNLYDRVVLEKAVKRPLMELVIISSFWILYVYVF